MLGALSLALAALLALYAAYWIKGRLGIDLFPRWGLHLWGPRTLVRQLWARAKRTAPATRRP